MIESYGALFIIHVEAFKSPQEPFGERSDDGNPPMTGTPEASISGCLGW
jgi:hypothetical protein